MTGDVERVAPDDLSPMGAIVWEFVNDPALSLSWSMEVVEFLKSPPAGEGWVLDELEKDDVVSFFLRYKTLAGSEPGSRLARRVGLEPIDLLQAAGPGGRSDAALLVPQLNRLVVENIAATRSSASVERSIESLWSGDQLAEWVELAADELIERITDPVPTDFKAGMVASTMLQASRAPRVVDEALVTFLLGRSEQVARNYANTPGLFSRLSFRDAFVRRLQSGPTTDRLKAAEFLVLGRLAEFASDLAVAAEAESDPGVRQEMVGHLESLGFWLEDGRAVSKADARVSKTTGGGLVTVRNVIAVDYRQFYMHRMSGDLIDIDGVGHESVMGVDGDRAFVPAGTFSGHAFGSLSMHDEPLGDVEAGWQHVAEGSFGGSGAFRVQGWDDIEMGRLPFEDEVVRFRVHWRHHLADMPFVAVEAYPGEWEPTPEKPVPPFDAGREEIWIAVWVESAVRATEVLVDSTS